MKIKEGLADIKPVLKLGTYCKNKEKSYGQICVGRNKCGRFDRKKGASK